MRRASLAIFFLAMGLGDVLPLGTPALGGYRRRGVFRLVSPAEGTGALAPVHFNLLHAACAYGQTHA